MSRGKNLQEMETGTTQSRTAVNANAQAAEPMQKLSTGIAPGQTGSWEDLGGPTPENYRSDDDSSKLRTPGVSLKQVKDVVNKGAKAPDSMQTLSSGSKKEETEEDEEYDQEEENEKKKSSRHRKMEENHKMKKEDEEYEEDDEDEDDEDDDEEDDDENEGKSKRKKMKESIDIEEDVNALLEGEDLSEEFRDKAKLIFETAINSKISEIYESLENRYEEELLEEVNIIKEQIVERVDAYLEYVADEWLQENALVVEQGIKTEMTESFLQGMKNLFEDHYVSIPEEKYDVLESMVDKLDEMESKLNEQISRNIALNQRLAESVANVIFSEISEGLSTLQKDKLASLSESVEFESEENYREKLVTLRESYFPRNTSTQRDHSELLSEEMNYGENISGTMGSYLQTLSRVSKK
jgi:hypothetical protein